MGLVLTYGWDETVPKGTENVSTVDDYIRKLKVSVREIFGVDHKMDATGDAADFGKHIKVSLLLADDDLLPDTNSVVLYAKANDRDDDEDETECVIFKNTEGKKRKLLCMDDMEGMIAMWSGTLEDLAANKKGWVLCDGDNDTPDLRDKFIIGAGNDYDVSEEGGEAEHTLTIAEMPKHTHRFFRRDGGGGGGTGGGDYNATGANYGITWQGAQSIEDTGADTAHNNLPPYYALAYIMFKGY